MWWDEEMRLPHDTCTRFPELEGGRLGDEDKANDFYHTLHP